MRWWSVLAVGAWVAHSGCVQDAAFRGPMQVRNQHPAQLLVLRLPATGTGVLAPGETSWRVGAAYSSLFLNGDGNGATIALDGEYLRTSLEADVGLGDGLELGVELPFAHTSGGFLDHFLVEYHDFFGLPNQDRATTVHDRWQVVAARAGNPAFRVDSEALQLLDVPLTLTWNLLPPDVDRFGLALRGGVELPTGDQDHGFSDGGVDYSLGVLGEYRLPWLGLSAQLQHTFAATPDLARAAGIHFGDVTSLEAGAELPLLPGLSAILQMQWESSTLRELGFSRAAKDQVLLWSGARIDLARDWCTELSLGEDLAGFVSPDFTVYWSLVYRPGAPR